MLFKDVYHKSNLIPSARWFVPKMVKNGIYSSSRARGTDTIIVIKG
jgi:hypothetical protein